MWPRERERERERKGEGEGEREGEEEVGLLHQQRAIGTGNTSVRWLFAWLGTSCSLVGSSDMTGKLEVLHFYLKHLD